MNMNYCKFENTENDIEICIDALQERESISHSETRAAKRMFANIISFLVDEEIIKDKDAAIFEINKIIEECDEEE